jgi:hypothetical protein
MRRLTTKACQVAAAVCVLATAPGRPLHSAAQDRRFDVNDVSYLWPPPANAEEISSLIPGDLPSADGAGRLWPESVFKLLLQTATSFTVEGSAGTFRIRFDGFEKEFANQSTWKLVGFRVDPSAPGGHAGFVTQFGSTPQLRLIFQPVTLVAGAVKVHDVTAHLAFSYTKPGGSAFPAIPDRDAMRETFNELHLLKVFAETGGAATAGPLRVHPGLRGRVPGLTERVKTFLQGSAARGQLTDLAFMGIDPPEPWIFFAMRKRASDGSFERVASKAVDGRDAQMLVLKGGEPVMPRPTTMNLPPLGGVSTASLFRDDAGTRLLTPAFTTAPSPLHQDIPDVIANPTLSHVLNTDCVSCHTESTRRSLLKISANDPKFRYTRPEGISGVDEAHLPRTIWNVRNFGWFHPRVGQVLPTITMRTANESADAADFVNREYFGVGRAQAPAHQPTAQTGNEAKMAKAVASPLTLVMNIKSPQDFLALKKKIEHMQSLPPDKNPIVVALNTLNTVHFARFVFLNERQLAVITTYDGTFDDYIDAFANTIGDVFDQLLEHVSDAPPRSVKLPQNRQAFLDYVRKNDLTAVPPFYSAYPSLKVLDILTLQKQKGGS